MVTSSELNGTQREQVDSFGLLVGERNLARSNPSLVLMARLADVDIRQSITFHPEPMPVDGQSHTERTAPIGLNADLIWQNRGSSK